MKKKVIIVVGVVVVAALIFGVGELAGMFPWQYINEDKVEAFLEDSKYTFAYELPDSETKVEYNSILTNELATQMAAVIYTERNELILSADQDAYEISNEELENEKTSLFMYTGEDDFTDSQLLTSTEDGYSLHLRDAQYSDLSYEIVDSFYGLIGSEPTRITVLYKLNGEECTVEYNFASDKESPYTFQVADITINE